MTPSQAQSVLALEADLARTARELDHLREQTERLLRDLHRQGGSADKWRDIDTAGYLVAARYALLAAQALLESEFRAAAELAPPDEEDAPF